MTFEIDSKLPPGNYRLRGTFQGSYEVEEGEHITVREAIDGMMPGAELVDCEISEIGK